MYVQPAPEVDLKVSQAKPNLLFKHDAVHQQHI